MRLTVGLGLLLVLSGCASRTVVVADGELNREVFRQVVIEEVKLDLTSKKQPAGYMDNVAMLNLLRDGLQKNLAEKQIASADGVKLKITVNYERNFAYGDSLAKPHFSYVVDYVNRDGSVTPVVKTRESTSFFGYFEDGLVNAQVATGNWDFADEPRDIEMLALAITHSIESLAR
jgi:hypothetical protein